jgi:hypothetical protein
MQSPCLGGLDFSSSVCSSSRLKEPNFCVSVYFSGALASWRRFHEAKNCSDHFTNMQMKPIVYLFSLAGTRLHISEDDDYASSKSPSGGSEPCRDS